MSFLIDRVSDWVSGDEEQSSNDSGGGGGGFFSGLSMPDISMPDISMPDISLPDISMPDIPSPGEAWDGVTGWAHDQAVDTVEWLEESGTADRATELIGDGLNLLEDGVDTVGDGIDFLGEVGEDAVEGAGEIFDWAVDNGTELLAPAIEAGGDALDWAIEGGGELLDRAADAGSGFVDWVADNGSELLGPVLDAGGEALDFVVDGGKELLEPVVRHGSDFLDWAAESGRELLDPVLDAGSDVLDWAVQEGTELLQPALDLGGDVLDWVIEGGSDLMNRGQELLEDGGELMEDIGELFGIESDDSGMLTDRLSPEQQEFLEGYFGDSLDLSVVRFSRDNIVASGAPNNIGNQVNLRSKWGPDIFDEDGNITDQGMELVIHELTHTTQYQNDGWDYAPEALWSNLEAWVTTGDRNNAYTVDTNMDWADMNPEQQAHAIEHHGYLSWRQAQGEELTDAELAELEEHEKYYDEMRAGRGM